MSLKKKSVKLMTLVLLSLPLVANTQSAVKASADNQIQTYQTKYSYDSISNKLNKIKNNSKELKLIDKAIEYNYWHKPDFSSTQKVGVTSSNNNEALEKLYQSALKISPNNPKYLLGLAAVNNILGKTNESATIWKKVIKQNPNNFQALVNLATYENFNHNNNAYNKLINKMNKLDREKTKEYQKTVKLINKSANMKLNTDVQKVNNNNHADHYIVILGFVLDSKGNIQPTLEQRLNAGLELAKEQPKAKIVVSGGELPSEPKVEAQVMKKWLMKHGISAKRIITEEHSLDTTQNAINTSKILKKQGAKSVTLVSSASHMRRAYTLFSEAKLVQNNKYSLNHLVSVDSNDALKSIGDNYQGLNKIINDTLRVEGYWLLPTIQR